MKKILYLFAVIALVTTVACNRKEQVTQGKQAAPAEQNLAPDITVNGFNGTPLQLSSLKGKVVMLNFWATWCPPCVQETPSLSQFAAAYAGKGVVVLGISVDKDEKAYRAFLQKYNPAFLTAREFKIHEDYGTFMYPETYIIDSKGKVLQKFAEPADWMDPRMTQLIDSLL